MVELHWAAVAAVYLAGVLTGLMLEVGDEGPHG